MCKIVLKLEDSGGLGLQGVYLILIGIGAEVVQCSILVLGLVTGGVEAETDGVQENTLEKVPRV